MLQNNRTKETQWQRPLLLGNIDIKATPRSRLGSEVKKPVKKAEDMTVEEAASKLQGMWRARRARRMLIKIIRENVQKVERDKARVWGVARELRADCSCCFGVLVWGVMLAGVGQ